MDVDEARTILGVGSGASPAAVRAAYRRLVRAHHPDVVPGESATARTARINQAYAVVRGAGASTVAVRPGGVTPADVAPADVTAVDGDTLAVTAPAEEAFFLLLDAAHRIGDVTHVDPDGGLLETLVSTRDGRICSLVISFQGRANGTTEAFLTVEALDAGPTPPVSELTAHLAAAIAG